MTGLPASIEAYLVECGFSATELLILRHALSGEAMTLRELATKTGKSTGVLDQATKKLISKQILTRKKVNGVPKYTVDSVDAIKRWMARDMQKKHDTLKRKEQDFQHFVDSLEIDASRPKMEYFEGVEGIQKAYMRLLDTDEKLMRQFLPMQHKEEEDPLRDFRVRFFRERKKRNIFLQALAHNTPLGRRFQSRDHFEFRQTLLVPESECPISFEKIIIGETVACFNHPEQRACFIHYPELAQAERAFFAVAAGKAETAGEASGQGSAQGEVSFTTNTLSSLRSFFLSSRNLASLAICAVFAAFIVHLFYLHTLNLIKAEVGQRLMSIAATVAPEINAEAVNSLRFAKDMHTEAYSQIFNKLNQVRDNNQDIQYVYILKPTKDPTLWQFAADADSSFELLAAKDEPGQIEVISPGTFYDISVPESSLKYGMPNAPLAERDFVHDKWGSYLSAYAPLRDKKGEPIAILGVDMDVTDVLALAKRKFVAWQWFFICFAAFVCFRVLQLTSISSLISLRQKRPTN